MTQPTPFRHLACCAALIVFVGGVPEATAQQFGQWSWQGAVGLGQRSAESRRQASRLSRFEQQDLRVGLALDGFIVHPAVGSFRLGLDLHLSETEGLRGLDTDSTGLAAELGLFPHGGYPLRLYLRRQRYDYSTADNGGLLPLLGAPDRSTDWGGRLRLRRGPLKGTLLGLERRAIDFLNPDARRERRDREFVDWTRSGRRLRHHLRLEHRLQEFGTIDLDVDDLTLNFNQSGDLSERWGWQLFGVGIRRDVRRAGDAGSLFTESLRARQRLYRSMREKDLLDISTEVGVISSDRAEDLRSRGISVIYRWRLAPSWEVAPFAGYAMQSSGDGYLQSPRAGVRTTWTRRRQTIDLLLSARLTYGRTERRSAGGSDDESRLSYAVNGSVGHGDVASLRKELEVEVARNELRLTGKPNPDLPDLGLPRRQLGDDDLHRLRGSLSRSWGARRLDAWAEWRAEKASDGARTGSFESDTLSGSVQLGDRRWNAQATVGRTHNEGAAFGGQEVSYLAAAATFRPWRSMRMRGHYRTDTRDFPFAPQLEGERIEMGLKLRLGQSSLTANAFRNEERGPAAGTRTNRGFNWSISRNLGGWLPIVTGTRRRGVIR